MNGFIHFSTFTNLISSCQPADLCPIPKLPYQPSTVKPQQEEPPVLSITNSSFFIKQCIINATHLLQSKLKGSE